jgi:LPS-assembly lipoprotein
MWWSSRKVSPRRALGRFRLLTAAAPLLLAACGWHPLYGRLDDSGGAGLELASVHIQPIADRTGQNLYNELRDRMNPAGVPADPHYDLVIGLTEQYQQYLVQTDQTATRVDLTLYANFALYQRGSTGPLMIGQSRTTTSYDQLTNQYASVVSAEDARRRGAVSIADDIANRIAVYLAQPPDQRPPPPSSSPPTSTLSAPLPSNPLFGG